MVAYLEQRKEPGKLAIAQFMVLILKSILEQIGGNHATASFLKIMNIFSFFFIYSEYKTRWFVAILEILKWFAGHQIRNVGVILLGNA